MRPTVDYFIAPQSPWTYLGHARFVAMARDAGATIRLRPTDLGRVFPVSGGLPLPQRAPQRQAYRLVELERFARWLKLPLNLHPKFFPVAGDPASRLICTVDRLDGIAAALALTGEVLSAVWVHELDIADPATLARLLDRQGLPADRLAASTQPQAQADLDVHTQAAIDAGVFGAPSYVIGGEIFWGQDRLDFVQRRLLQR